MTHADGTLCPVGALGRHFRVEMAKASLIGMDPLQAPAAVGILLVSAAFRHPEWLAGIALHIEGELRAQPEATRAEFDDHVENLIRMVPVAGDMPIPEEVRDAAS